MPQFNLENLRKFFNLRIIILGVIAVLVIIGIAAFFLGKKESVTREEVTLEIWGVFDDRDVYKELFREYENQNSNVTIKYQKLPFENYEEELINAFAEGRAPDIWMMHNTWLPKHIGKMSPLPAEIMKVRDYRDTFFDTAFRDLSDEAGNIYGIPLSVDTLVLYYNKDIFASAGIAAPPKTWEEFKGISKKLTLFDSVGNITRSGAAFGTARNVNRSTDILYLLMLQSGAEMVNERKTDAKFDRTISAEEGNFSPGELALRFYTDFADPEKDFYTWNRDQFFSVDAFFTGRAAMTINYSHLVPTLESKAPRLNFAVAPVPQINDSSIDPAYTDVNYANYWAFTVSRTAGSKIESWRLIKFLSEFSNDAKYALASRRPVSRKDLTSWQKDDFQLGVFAEQALSARSWYQVNNNAIEKIFADMIEAVNLKQKLPREALREAADEVGALMR